MNHTRIITSAILDKPALLLGGLVAVLVLTALARVFDAFPGDEWALLRLAHWRTDELSAVARAFNETGWLGIFFPWFPLAATAAVALSRRWVDVVFLVGAASLPSLLNLALKELAARPRPDAALALVDSGGYSFPSGHSVFAAAFLGALIYLLGSCDRLTARPAQRLMAQALLALIVLFIGFSRVYLGAHWPSDVIVGFFFGGACLAVLASLHRSMWVPR